jgi:1,2-diacylglycerol 3-beta-galactosyltransferase
MAKIDFVYFDAGGGHRAAATALQAVIAQQERGWEVRLVHLIEVLQTIDVFRQVLRIDLQEIYNTMLRKGWTLGSAQGLRFMHWVIRRYHRPAVRLIAEHFRRDPPDLLVSVVPNFNRAIYEGFQEAAPGRPYATILTDLADFPPNFWIERQPQYFVCGTKRAIEQARAMGHPDNRIFAASGMILRPIFYEEIVMDRAAERSRLGLDPKKPAALVLFGGYGSAAMETIAARLDESDIDLQLILICGRNEKLNARLQAGSARKRRFVEGFTSDIPRYMKLADFFIGKPGPGSVSEALHMGLPVITERNAWTLPQERFNAEWIEENELGLVVHSFREIVPAVRKLLEGGRWANYRDRAARIRNRAVFEIPDLLAAMLKR